MGKERTCLLCGGKYKYCPHCDKDSSKPTWYFLFCSEICHELDNILSNHTHGKLTTEEAKKKIEKLDMTKINIQYEPNKKHIEEILSFHNEPSKEQLTSTQSDEVALIDYQDKKVAYIAKDTRSNKKYKQNNRENIER